MPAFADDARPLAAIMQPFPCSTDHAAFGLMDPTHAPFVHTSWWFKKQATTLRPKEKQFEPIELGWRMVRHPLPPQNLVYKLLGDNVETEISYQLPGLRIEETHGDRHAVVGLTAITPVTDETTEVHHIFWVSTRWAALACADHPAVHAHLPWPGPRSRGTPARRPGAQAAADADQRRRHPGALVDARQGRMDRGAGAGARLRQSARTQDPALAQLSRTAPMTDLATLETELLAAIAAADDEAALEAVRVAALGRNGSVSALLKTLGAMTPDERREQGARITASRTASPLRSRRARRRSSTRRSISASTPRPSTSRCRCASRPPRSAASIRSAR